MTTNRTAKFAAVMGAAAWMSAKSVKGTAKLVRLSAGSTAATNTINDPKRVVPVAST